MVRKIAYLSLFVFFGLSIPSGGVVCTDNITFSFESSTKFNEEYYYFFNYDGWKITENHNLQNAVDSGQYIWNGEFLTLSYDGTSYVFNPLTHSRYAITSYQTGNYQITVAAADFLVRNMTYDGFCPLNYPIDYFNTSIPWVCGMAQSYVIRCLLRAYEITDNNSYLDAALKVVLSYTYPWQEGGFIYSKENRSHESGGFTYNFNETSAWYLEAGTIKETEIEFILNGHIYALFGLWEYFHHPYTSNKSIAEILFNKGLSALLTRISEYELPFGCSRYALRVLGKPRYMKKHVYQLELLYRLTNNSVLKYYYNYWKPSCYINSDFAPKLVSLNACRCSTGIQIFWETDIPSKTAIEWREHIIDSVVFEIGTLSKRGAIWLKSPQYDKFRFYFANQDNITRFYDYKFSNIIQGLCNNETTFQDSGTTSNNEDSLSSTTSNITVSFINGLAPLISLYALNLKRKKSEI